MSIIWLQVTKGQYLHPECSEGEVGDSGKCKYSSKLQVPQFVV